MVYNNVVASIRFYSLSRRRGRRREWYAAIFCMFWDEKQQKPRDTCIKICVHRLLPIITYSMQNVFSLPHDTTTTDHQSLHIL